MTAFAVDVAELDIVVARLGASHALLADRVAELEQAVRAGQHDWTGAASEAHAAAHERLMTGAAEIRAALAGLQAAARQAHGSYTAATEANTLTWRQLG